MKLYLSMLVGLLAACSGSAEKQVAAPCPEELITNRASDAKAADTIVVGKRVAADPDITPEIPIRVGTIEVAKSILGSLPDGETVVVLTSNISDNAGKIFFVLELSAKSMILGGLNIFDAQKRRSNVV